MSSDRHIGMALGPIPFGAIDRYAERFEIEGDDFDYFVRMIRAMDKVVLAHGNGAPRQPARTGRILSPELFDAVFG